MTKYFAKHPLITYNGMACRNIMTRVDLSEQTKKNGVAFYPYTVNDAERVDNLAYNYYDDPDYAWLVFLSNQIIDPYFDYPLNDQQLNDFIVAKYGSIAKAQKIVKYYRNNWASDSTVLTVAGYEAKPTVEKKYWAPQLGENGAVIGYVRKQVDWTYENARIEKHPYSQSETWGTYNIDTRGAGRFQAGDLVMNAPTQAAANLYAIVATSAEVTFTLHKFTTLTLDTGFSPSLASAWYKYDDPTVYEDDLDFAESSLTYNPEQTEYLDVADFPQMGIPEDEASYYEYVSAYQYEIELNEKKKDLVLVDKRFASSLSNDLRKLLRK